MDRRFWFNVHKTETCWLWTGSTSDGYGHVKRGGKVKAVHRISWELAHGPIPANLVVDHKCRVRNCINPDHLRIVSVKINNTENVIGANWQIQKQKTHCKNGHSFDEKNTYLYKRKNGNMNRYCRTCIAKNTQTYRGRIGELRGQ